LRFTFVGKKKSVLPEKGFVRESAVARFASGAPDVEFSRVLLEEMDDTLLFKCLDENGEVWEYTSRPNDPSVIVKHHFIDPEMLKFYRRVTPTTVHFSRDGLACIIEWPFTSSHRR
jgi:hypothetical protein